MSGGRIKALLIEDEPDDALLVGLMLAEAKGAQFDLRRAALLAEGLDLLRAEDFDVVVLDLSLPDAQGLTALARVRTQAPTVPIVVISALDDQALAVKAVGSGAQDYLLKGRFTGDLLSRAMRYAIERQRLENALEQAEQWERGSWVRLEAARDSRYYVAMGRDGGPLANGEPAAALPAELAAEYRKLVIDYVQSDRAIELRPIKRLRELARRLAEAGAAARDVMRLHLDLLAELERLAGPDELPEVLTDVRLVLLDLMGSLVDEYRGRRAPGGGSSQA